MTPEAQELRTLLRMMDSIRLDIARLYDELKSTQHQMTALVNEHPGALRELCEAMGGVN